MQCRVNLLNGGTVLRLTLASSMHCSSQCCCSGASAINFSIAVLARSVRYSKYIAGSFTSNSYQPDTEHTHGYSIYMEQDSSRLHKYLLCAEWQCLCLAAVVHSASGSFRQCLGARVILAKPNSTASLLCWPHSAPCLHPLLGPAPPEVAQLYPFAYVVSIVI